MLICGQRKLFGEFLLSLVLIDLTSTLALGGSPGDLKPRVPPERFHEAQSFQNPFRASEDIAAKGKKLYEGKAYCSACHGLEGVGGATGSRIPGTPPPTHFADGAGRQNRWRNLLDS